MAERERMQKVEDQGRALDALSSQLPQLLPLVLEQRPGKILDYDAASRDVTWIWQSYNSDGERINHPNGLVGTNTFMPARAVGNADMADVILPVEAWFRKRLTSTDVGPVYEFDANCCPPPTPGSGAPGCCDGLTPATIPLTVTGVGEGCDDCFPFDVDLIFVDSAQRWKGQHDCTIGDCTFSFHFMLQCYDCSSPPALSDCSGFDCTDPTAKYFCLTYWVVTSGDGCPSSQVGTTSWSEDEVICDPFSLPAKPLDINLGPDCDVEITVYSGGPFPPPPCPDVTITIYNVTGCSQFAGDSYTISWNSTTGRYEGSSSPIASLLGSVHSTWVQVICPEGHTCAPGSMKVISQTSLLPCAGTSTIVENCTTLGTPGDCCTFLPVALSNVGCSSCCDCDDSGPLTPMAIGATLSI